MLVEPVDNWLVLEPLGIVHVEGMADVLIEDSYVGAFWIDIPGNIPVVIDSLQYGYFDYWSARESISDSLSYNLVLRRTEVIGNTKGYIGGIELGRRFDNLLKQPFALFKLASAA